MLLGMLMPLASELEGEQLEVIRIACEMFSKHVDGLPMAAFIKDYLLIVPAGLPMVKNADFDIRQELQQQLKRPLRDQSPFTVLGINALYISTAIGLKERGQANMVSELEEEMVVAAKTYMAMPHAGISDAMWAQQFDSQWRSLNLSKLEALLDSLDN